MKRHTMLVIASLLSILLLMFHFTDDILREGGLAVHGVADLIGVIGLFSFVLSVRGLWKREWAQPR